MKDKWGTEIDDKEFVDDRTFESSTIYLLHRIRDRIRECEKYNINYEDYIDRKELEYIIDQLNCCLNHKDSKYISRREWNR